MEVDKGIPEEGTQPYSLQDYDLCRDFEKEYQEKENEGSSLTLGRTSYDIIIVSSLQTKMLSSCIASSRLSNQCKLISLISFCLNRTKPREGYQNLKNWHNLAFVRIARKN